MGQALNIGNDYDFSAAIVASFNKRIGQIITANKGCRGKAIFLETGRPQYCSGPLVGTEKIS